MCRHMYNLCIDIQIDRSLFRLHAGCWSPTSPMQSQPIYNDFVVLRQVYSCCTTPQFRHSCWRHILETACSIWQPTLRDDCHVPEHDVHQPAHLRLAVLGRQQELESPARHDCQAVWDDRTERRRHASYSSCELNEYSTVHCDLKSYYIPQAVSISVLTWHNYFVYVFCAPSIVVLCFTVAVKF